MAEAITENTLVEDAEDRKKKHKLEFETWLSKETSRQEDDKGKENNIQLGVDGSEQLHRTIKRKGPTPF